MATVVNQRSLKDELAKVTKALPAAAASNTTDGIYIGEAGPHRDGLKVKVELPANAVLVATKLLTLALWDSADNSTFAATSPAQSYVITGDTGFAATEIFFEIPKTARAYVAVRQTVETGGGDNTGTSSTVYVVS